MKSKSVDYYISLLRQARGVASTLRRDLNGVVHKSFLKKPDKVNLMCYEVFRGNHGKLTVPERRQVQELIPGLVAVCASCAPFFLKRRSALNKAEDISTGVVFQQPFIQFLKQLDIDAFDTSELDIRLPDVGVRNNKGSIVALLELKYHNAPFIRVRSMVSPSTECYDGSLTVDVAKCKKQVEVAKKTYPKAKRIMVHWVDFPCIKCVLWSTLDSAAGPVAYERKQRSGDYEYGRKVGYTEKTYHFVRNMNDFESLVSSLQEA